MKPLTAGFFLLFGFAILAIAIYLFNVESAGAVYCAPRDKLLSSLAMLVLWSTYLGTLIGVAITAWAK